MTNTCFCCNPTNDIVLLAELATATAEIERLRVALRAREAQLQYAQRQLTLMGRPLWGLHGELEHLRQRGMIASGTWTHRAEVTEVVVITHEHLIGTVDAEMLQMQLYPAGKPIPEGGQVSRCYSTAGTPPWKTL